MENSPKGAKSTKMAYVKFSVSKLALQTACDQLSLKVAMPLIIHDFKA